MNRIKFNEQSCPAGPFSLLNLLFAQKHCQNMAFQTNLFFDHSIFHFEIEMNHPRFITMILRKEILRMNLFFLKINVDMPPSY